MKVSDKCFIFSNILKVCLTSLLFLFALWYVVLKISPFNLDAISRFVFRLTVSPGYFVYDHPRFFLDYRIQFFNVVNGQEKLVKETVITNKNWNQVIGGSSERKDIIAHSAGWATKDSSPAAQRILNYYNCNRPLVLLDNDIATDQKFSVVKIVSTSSEDRSFKNVLTVKCVSNE